MDKVKNTSFKYEIFILISLILCVAGTVYSYLNPSILAIFIFPAISYFFGLLLWAITARFILRRDEQRFMNKSFKRPLKFALFPTAGALALLLLLAMPRTPAVDAAHEESLIITAFAFIIIVLPLVIVAIVVFGALAFSGAINHMRRTPLDESAFYRKGPLVFAITVYGIMFLIVIIFALTMLQGAV